MMCADWQGPSCQQPSSCARARHLCQLNTATRLRACKLSINVDKCKDTGTYCKAAKITSMLEVVPTGVSAWSVATGMTLEQAQVLSELFSGRAMMVASPAPCNMAQLQAYYSRSVMHTHACGVSRITEQASQ